MNRTRCLGRWCAAAAVLLLAAGAARPVQAAGPGVNGRVLAIDEKGLPRGNVAGAVIEFKDRSGKVAARVTANKQGYYKANLPPGTYTYKVLAPGFKDEDSGRGISLTLSEGYAVYNFSLIRGKNDPTRKGPAAAMAAVGTLKGRVQEKTADGKLVGIPRAAIALRKAAGKELNKVTARGDDPKENGSYEVTLDAGSYQVSVAAPGFQTQVVPAAVAITKGKTEVRDVVLTRLTQPEPSGQGLKGVVTFADAKGPPPKVKLSIRPLAGSGAAVDPLKPDAKGGFQRDLRSGRYQVVAEAEGYRTAVSAPRDVLAGKYSVVELHMTPALNELRLVTTVYERLPGSGGRKPLPGVSVLVRKEGASLSSASKGTTDARGKVSLKVGTPGKYQILARLKGYKPAGAPAKCSASGENRADLVLVREVSVAALNVQVVEGKGKSARPIANAKIVITQEGRPVKSGTSDAKGGQSFSLPIGSYRLEVTHDGYAPVHEEVRLVAEGARHSVVLAKRTTAKAALNLHVVEKLKSGDKAIAGAEVVVSQKDKRLADDKTGPDGRLKAMLPPGTYTATVTKPGYKPAVLQVEVTAEDVAKEITLVHSGMVPGKKAALNLHVVEKLKAADKAVAGARVVVSQKEKRLDDEKTDADGRLALMLPPGNYTVSVSKSGYKTVTVQVSVGTQDVGQEIILTRAK